MNCIHIWGFCKGLRGYLKAFPLSGSLPYKLKTAWAETARISLRRRRTNL
ncbi:hypothetical protein HMPREF9371_1615 [Neisseria shayeganii 871]|uniref:Uncharacterized protein n=1 Tax=Neisseria shayeganii 871 TaxID=1032488 RepID=G4CJ26_9NEIS|nr:hypothetical protein HMPREF9371_1615 [Neisseria shayeganii 871]